MRLTCRIAPIALLLVALCTTSHALNRVGDADLDGAVTMNDAALILSAHLGTVTPAGLSPLALTNGDSNLNLTDAMQAGQSAAGLIIVAGPGGLTAVTAPADDTFDSDTVPVPLSAQVVSLHPAATRVDGLEVLADFTQTNGEASLTSPLTVAAGNATTDLTPYHTGGTSTDLILRWRLELADSSGAGLGIDAQDSMTATILPPVCGNGLQQFGETCDDGNTVDCDGCIGNCSRADDVCGDGIVECGETCDDGNTLNDPVCAAYCTDEPDAYTISGSSYRVLPQLGRVTDPELFDCLLRTVLLELPPWHLTFTALSPVLLQIDFFSYGYTGLISDNWGTVSYANAPYFTVSDPDGFAIPIDGTLTLYFRNVTVSGYFEPGAEEIESLTIHAELDSTLISALLGIDLCDVLPCTVDNYLVFDIEDSISQIVSATCGNGTIEPPEQCDDGNTTSEDGCSAICRNEYCGDRVVQTVLGETCDDGDLDNTDYCLDNCQPNVCGDGAVYAGVEECDDGVANGPAGPCLTGCISTWPAGPAPISGTQVLFSLNGLESGSAGFFQFPWPSDLRLNPDGTLNLDNFPDPFDALFVGQNIPIIATNTEGFGTSAGIYLTLDGPLDPASLPIDADASRQAGATAFLMDVDPASPLRGTRYPVEFTFFANKTSYLPANTLVALPFPGIPLMPDTQYALVLTDGVLDTGAQPLGAPADFERMKDPVNEGIPFVDTARALYTPVFDYLQNSHGIARSQVRAMTVYTTGNPVEGMFALHTAVNALPTPTANDLYASGYENNYYRYWGHYDTPIYQQGTVPYQYTGGNIAFDAGGVPQLVTWENLQFLLTTPTGTMPAGGWPVAIYAHGTGGSRYSPLGLNDECGVLAANGVAVLSITQPLHGDRVPAGSPSPEILTFNFINILAARDNWRQSAVDTLQAFRFIRQLNIPAGLTPTGSAAYFNPDKVYFMGHSQGAITGPLAIATEPDFKANVLSGAGGGLAVSILTKTQPIPIQLLATLMTCQEPVVEDMSATHPMLQVVQSYLEVSDTVNYGRFFLDEPTGTLGKSTLMTSGLLDGHSPPATLNAFATAIGMNQVGTVGALIEGLQLRGFGNDPMPAINNRLDGNSNLRTAGVVQYPSGDHFVIYSSLIAQYTYGHFLGTAAYNGQAAICDYADPSPACNFTLP